MSKKGKEIKVKKEPGVDEGAVSDVRTGSKWKAVVKGKDQGPRPKVRKSCASSSASAMSFGDSLFTSPLISSVPASSAITDGGSDMDVVDEDFSPDNANDIKQILAVLDGVAKNAEGIAKGARFLKNAIAKLGLAEGSDGEDN